MQKLSKYKQIVVFDIETTGLKATQDDIIDFGAVVVDGDFNEIDKVNKLVRTQRELSAVIVDLTGITFEMLAEGGINHEELADDIERLFTQDSLIVAYNIQFDIGFVVAFMKRMRPDYQFQADILDVMAIYKDNHPYPHRLENAAETYGIINENEHRAYDDAVVTLRVMDKMMDEYDVSAYINCIGFNERYGLSGPRFRHVKYYAHPYKIGSLLHQINQREKIDK